MEISKQNLVFVYGPSDWTGAMMEGLTDETLMPLFYPDVAVMGKKFSLIRIRNLH